MPCGSTDGTSTRYIKAVLPAFPDPGSFWQIPLSWLAGVASMSERRRQYAQLLDLDDRLLADIGLSRRDVDELALKSSCIDAWMWQVWR
jgi:uncharacterized protein YjiS (DUF1127 family)